MQYWDSDAIFEVSCPECEHPVEFYKDDTTRKCGHCGHRFVNPKMDFGCAAYCKYAEQCLGTLPKEFTGSQDSLLKDKVAVAVKRFYKTDFKKISQVSRIAHHAEKIGKEAGANMAIILCAAYLNDIGMTKARQKYRSEKAETVKQLSIAIATDILNGLGASPQVLNEVCNLLKIHNSDEASGVLESMILSDAERTAILEEKQKHSPLHRNSVDDWLKNEYRTIAGRKYAGQLFEHIR